MKKMIGRILCKIGLHKWIDKESPTLRCSRCGHIWCIWADGIRYIPTESNEGEIK